MKKKETLFDILLKVSELRMDIETAEKRILRLFSVSKRTCVTCLYCQANPSSEFRYDKHKCTLVNPFGNITDATKFVCDEWTEIQF